MDAKFSAPLSGDGDVGAEGQAETENRCLETEHSGDQEVSAFVDNDQNAEDCQHGKNGKGLYEK